MDTVDKATRSRIMSSIRSRDTKPEVELRSALFRAGARGFRKNTGRPSVDILWSGLKVAVFVDSCFWHRCPDHCKVPDYDFWRAKLQRNVDGDRRADEHYGSRGYNIVRLWTHLPLDEQVKRVLRALKEAK